MKPYIFGARNGIYIIDLQKTLKMFKEAYNFVKEVASRNEYVLFVGTKKQAQEAIVEEAKRCLGLSRERQVARRHAHELPDHREEHRQASEVRGVEGQRHFQGPSEEGGLEYRPRNSEAREDTSAA